LGLHEILWADMTKIVNPFYKLRWFYFQHLANPQWGFSHTKDIHEYIDKIHFAGYKTLTYIYIYIYNELKVHH